MSKTKIINMNESKIHIIGDNILYCNGIITAYYILPLTNYTITSDNGILYSIKNINDLLTNLARNKQEIKFSLQRISKIITKKDIIKNLIDTIKIYEPAYDMPPEFIKNIGNGVQDYCLLGVIIEHKDLNGNVEDLTIGKTAKSMINNLANRLFNISGNILDEDKIIQSENNIFNILRTRCARASKELVFYNYISKLYPCYNISYDKLSFIKDNSFSSILGSVTQTIEDNFGYFIMHNEGVDIFDLPVQDTYGCILTIKAFPKVIDSANFAMDYPGMQVNIKTIEKEKAITQLRRSRAADSYELDTAGDADANIEDILNLTESINIANRGINDIQDNDPQMCEFTANILVTGLDLEDLRNNTQDIISDLKDRDVLPAKSLSQALDFFNGYVKLDATNYEHFTSLQFPLSFQLNRGALVGDADGKYYVPSIGNDIV